MSMLDRIRRKLRRSDSRSSLACSEVVELIAEYLEGTLPPNDRARFDAHLEECEGCPNYLDQMHKSIQCVGQARDETIPPGVKEALLQAFRSWKQG